MAKKWIAGAIKRPGALTIKAKRAGKSISAFCSNVKAHPEHYSARTKRQCSLAKTLAGFRK